MTRHLGRAFRSTADFASRPAPWGVTTLLFVISMFTLFGFNYNQNIFLRETLCGIVQPYVVTQPGPSDPPPTQRGLALREGSQKAEQRLNCSADPFDGK